MLSYNQKEKGVYDMNIAYQESTVYFSTETDVYGLYERKSPTKYNRKCIDGSITGCGNCVGYCRYKEHPGFLTAEQRTKHDCLKKGCFYYVPKRAHKKESKVLFVDYSERVFALAKQLTERYEGMRVMRVTKANDRWTLSYVTISNEYPLDYVQEEIQKNIGETVAFVNLGYDFERCVQLIYS